MRTIGWYTLGLLALAILLLAGCGAQQDIGPTDEIAKNADGYTDITVEQLIKLNETVDPVLINVHIPYEGELPDTDLFIPFDDVTSYLDRLPNKEDTIVLYCRSGSMSTSAAKELVSLGYTNVYELDGGFNAWQAAGNELLMLED
jgi:rhodanese-related sulfurtransferase